MATTSALFWLVLIALSTALMWIPPVLNRLAVRGLDRTCGNPSPSDLPHAPWAERALAAHRNAVENLVVFAPLILASHLIMPNHAGINEAAMVYFWARIVHYLIYTIGMPYLRTLAFTIGWLATISVAIGLLRAMWVPWHPAF